MIPEEPNVHDLPQLRDRTQVFRDRAHAGEVVAEMLQGRRDREAIVFAIPAGGVPVAAVIARKLRLPLDVAVVSKITPPGNTEVGYGAVAFDGSVELNRYMLPVLGLSDRDVRAGIARTKEKVARRVELLRGGRPMENLTGETALLVDDGLASGFTMRLAAQALKKAGAERIVIAVPTACGPTVVNLTNVAEAIYCANLRSGPSFAVADAYQHWCDVDEQTAAEILSTLDQPEPADSDQT